MRSRWAVWRPAGRPYARRERGRWSGRNLSLALTSLTIDHVLASSGHWDAWGSGDLQLRYTQLPRAEGGFRGQLSPAWEARSPERLNGLPKATGPVQSQSPSSCVLLHSLHLAQAFWPFGTSETLRDRDASLGDEKARRHLSARTPPPGARLSARSTCAQPLHPLRPNTEGKVQRVPPGQREGVRHPRPPLTYFGPGWLHQSRRRRVSNPRPASTFTNMQTRRRQRGNRRGDASPQRLRDAAPPEGGPARPAGRNATAAAAGSRPLLRRVCRACEKPAPCGAWRAARGRGGAWRTQRGVARRRGAWGYGAWRSARGRGTAQGAMRTRAGAAAGGGRAVQRPSRVRVVRWRCRRGAGYPGCRGWGRSRSVGRDEDVRGAAAAEAGRLAGAGVSPRSEAWPFWRLLGEERGRKSPRGWGEIPAPSPTGGPVSFAPGRAQGASCCRQPARVTNLFRFADDVLVLALTALQAFNPLEWP